MLEVYSYAIQVFLLALIGFLVGLLLKEHTGIDYYSATSICVIFFGLAFFLAQILLNSYFGTSIALFDGFPDYLANQLGGFVLSLIFTAVYEKNFA